MKNKIADVILIGKLKNLEVKFNVGYERFWVSKDVIFKRRNGFFLSILSSFELGKIRWVMGLEVFKKRIV